MSFPIYLGSSPLCSQCPPARVCGSQPLRTPSAGGWSRGMATRRRAWPRSRGWKEARQPFQSIYSSTGRAEREKIALKVTMEHLSWRGPSWLRGWREHRCSRREPCLGLPWAFLPHQAWAPGPAPGIPAAGSGVTQPWRPHPAWASWCRALGAQIFLLGARACDVWAGDDSAGWRSSTQPSCWAWPPAAWARCREGAESGGDPRLGVPGGAGSSPTLGSHAHVVLLWLRLGLQIQVLQTLVSL